MAVAWTRAPLRALTSKYRFFTPCPPRSRLPPRIPYIPSTSDSISTSVPHSAAPQTRPQAPSPNAPIAGRKDEMICHPSRPVRLVNPENGSLLPPRRLMDILQGVDRDVEYVQAVGTIPSDQNPGVSLPICKVVNKKEAYVAAKKLKEAKKAKAASAPETKEIQLTWSVSPHDLSHKLAKATEVLQGGTQNKVVVVISAKKGQKAVEGENQRRQELMKSVRRNLEEGGGKESRDPEWRGKHMVALFWQSAPKKES